MKIAGRDFVATISGRISLKNTVQEHKVESGFIIADHIKPDPEEFHIEVFANDGELVFLKMLRDSREVFTIDFEDERGIYENVVVTELEAEREYKNSYTVSITLRRVQTAELKTELIVLENVQLSEKAPGGTVAGTQEKVAADTPPKQENKSWLDSILDWFGGIFGGG